MRITPNRILMALPATLIALLVLAKLGLPVIGIARILVALMMLGLCLIVVLAAFSKDKPKESQNQNDSQD